MSHVQADNGGHLLPDPDAFLNSFQLFFQQYSPEYLFFPASLQILSRPFLCPNYSTVKLNIQYAFSNNRCSICILNYAIHTKSSS